MRRETLIFFAAASFAVAAELRPDSGLIEAIRRRDVKSASALVNRDNVNTVQPDGSTPLSWAIFLDLPDLPDKLIAAGANVNAASEYGETPLTLAIANRNSALVGKLLKAGADPNTARWNGEHALMIAAGAGCLDCVKLLLEKGVDVNRAEPQRGQNALMWAAAEAHPEVVDLLIQKGADIKAVTKSGFTPLVFAVTRNNAPSVKLLLKAGADPEYALPDKTKLLLVAVSGNSTAAAMELLDGGASPSVTDRTGNTPLHIAAQNGYLDLVKKLIAKGAAVNALTNKAMAGAGGANAFRRPLGGEQTPLLLATKFNRVDVMKALIEAGADPKLKAQDGMTLLLAAAGSGHVEAARYAYQFDQNVKAVDDGNNTVMHATVGGGGAPATQDDLVDLVQFLADKGAPMDELDKRGRTPIQAGDGIPLDKPIQRMADIIVARGGTPKKFPKEYVKPTR